MTFGSTSLRLAVNARAGRAHLPFIRQKIRKAHALLRPPLRELSLAVVNDDLMTRLHAQFSSVATTTDALTFELDYDSRGRVAAGEVVICIDQARRQAGRRPTALRRELLLYALHGMLHLCGYDDKTPAGFAAMHQKEDQILTELGVGPVFAPARPGAPAKKSATPSRSVR